MAWAIAHAMSAQPETPTGLDGTPRGCVGAGSHSPLTENFQIFGFLSRKQSYGVTVMNVLPSRGRPGTPVTMVVDRALTREDMLELAAAGPETRVAPPMIQRLRSSHHRAAQLLAQGKDTKEVALLVNRTPQRIRDLTRDQMFQNLVKYYESQYNETILDQAQTLQETWIDIAQIATDEIRDRLENPDTIAEIPVSELRQLAAAGSDRTVAPPRMAQPPTQTPVKVTFNMGNLGNRTQDRITDRARVIDSEPDSK